MGSDVVGKTLDGVAYSGMDAHTGSSGTDTLHVDKDSL